MNDHHLLSDTLFVESQLNLKVLTKENAGDLFNLICFEDVRENIDGFRDVVTIVDAEDLIDSFFVAYHMGHGMLWGIFLKGHFVGFIGLVDLPYEPILFYAMDKNNRMKGIMKECVNKVTTHVHDCGFPLIKTQVHKGNLASIRVLVDCGYLCDNNGYYYHQHSV